MFASLVLLVVAVVLGLAVLDLVYWCLLELIEALGPTRRQQ